MHRTRQYLLAQTGHLMHIEEPPAPEGGSSQETPPEGASNEAPDDEGNDDQDGDDQGGNDFESLPAWAQAEIKKLRKGEARYRTSAKELQEKLAEAKTQDDIDAAIAQHKEREAELEVELAIKTHTVGFTPEQLALVDGKTPEEIEEKANKVRAAFTAAQEDPGSYQNPNASGGRRPYGAGDEGLSPRERAQAVRERSRRR